MNVSPVCSIAFVFIIAKDTPAEAAPPLLPGDYAGWIYFDSGPDMPVRLHINDGGGGVSATLDLPVFDLGGIAAFTTESTPDRLRLLVPDVSGFDVEFDLRPRPESAELSGRTIWSGENRTLEGDVYLHRSAEPLPWVSPADVPDASGVFLLGPSRSIMITRQSWGELFYTDPYTGRSGYLFAQSPSTLFAGQGPYVPTSVTATVELHHDRDAQVAAITWKELDGSPIRAERTQFLTEPARFMSGDVELVGEIVRLDGDAPRPGIVVIGGSDWDTAAGMRRFAHTFACFGFAVLTFDKRGHGESGGDPEVAFAMIAHDIAQAANMLVERPEVRNGGVGVFGYSRAGWHIPLAASMSENISFVIMFVPPAVSPAVQETSRRLAALRDSGVSDRDDLDLAQTYLEAMWSFAHTGRGGEIYLRLRDQVDRRGWLDTLEGPPTLDEPEWRWSRLNAHYDPLPALRRMTCPVLAVFGGADSNVTPQENLPLMREALRNAGNADATLVVVPAADHGLRLMSSPSERVHNRRSIAPEVWPMVHRWLVDRTGLEPVR